MPDSNAFIQTASILAAHDIHTDPRQRVELPGNQDPSELAELISLATQRAARTLIRPQCPGTVGDRAFRRQRARPVVPFCVRRARPVDVVRSRHSVCVRARRRDAATSFSCRIAGGDDRRDLSLTPARHRRTGQRCANARA